MSKIIIAIILLSCFVSLYHAEPGAGVVLGKAVFHETGLTSGTLWKVSLSGTNYTSTTDTITVNNIVMGAVVSWIVYVPTGYTSNSTLTGGYQQTASEQHDFYVTFTALRYNVIFKESGLPSGINWVVTFNGANKSSSDSTITFTNVADGSYNYSVNAPTGYSSSVASGQIIVSGKGEQQAINFTQSDSWWTIGNGPTHTGYAASRSAVNDLLWSQRFGNPMMGGESNPAIVDGILYATTGSFTGLYLINASTGETINTFTTVQISSYSSPTIANGVIYIGSQDHAVYALNATTGSTIWSFMTGGVMQGSPAVVNGVLYIGSADSKVYALNATNGNMIWDHTTTGNVWRTPAVAGNIVYAVSFSTTSSVFSALNITNGEELWHYQLPDCIYLNVPVVGDGIVYQTFRKNSDAGGNFVALNATTGAEIWNVSKISWASPALANDVIFFPSVAGGDRYMYAFNATTGNQIWATAYSGTSGAQPCIAGGVVYYKTDREVGAYNTTNGETQWTYALDMMRMMEGGRDSGIAIANGILYVPEGEGYIEALGSLNQYNLTISTVGNGSVSPSNQTYYDGASVNLVAIAEEGWAFSGWSGDASGTENTTITMDENKAVTATFTQNGHAITVTQGSHGTITPNSTTVAVGGNQTFSIQPDTGYHVEDVIVDGVPLGEVNSYAFSNVQKIHNITATYELNDYTLTVNTVGNGTVTRTPENADYQYGDSVQLSAVPDNGWVFSGWSGDASGTSDATIVIDGNKDVTATFTQMTYQVNFTLSGADENYTGTVLTVDGVGYGMADLPKTFTWEYGSTHTYSFNSTLPIQTGEQYSWNSTTGLSNLRSGSCIVTAEGTINVAYNTQYLLTVTSAKGTVSGSGWYNAGTTATASISQSMISTDIDTRYTFKGWSGDASGAQTSISMLMDQPRTATANWETLYRVTIMANPLIGGTAAPSTTWTKAGTLSISCTPLPNYQFTSWSSTNQITITSSTSAATTAAINGPGTITANFYKPDNIVYATGSNGKQTELQLSGNISASQMTNIKLKSSAITKTTTLSFTVTGQSGTVGFGNITIPKSSVTTGTKPVVYIDGKIAENQGYAQDADNYYVWYNTHFSEHEITVEFVSEQPAQTTTPQPTQASISNLTLPAAAAAIIIAVVLLGLLVQKRRKSSN